MATKKKVTKKLAPKKVAKKAATTKDKPKEMSLLTFNKANTLLLADTIFSDKDGRVSMLKLCSGDLSNGRDGKRVLHCAVGEAYYEFVDRNVKQVYKDADKVSEENYKKNKDSNWELGLPDVYESKYATVSLAEGETALAVDRLVEKAVLKASTPANKTKLANALAAAVRGNDDVGHDSDFSLETFIERSESVAQIFRSEVAPLLK